MNRKYEMMFILDVGDELKTKEQIKEILQNQNAIFLKEEDLGIKNLAYKIKKREKGFYYLVEVEFPASSFKEINTDIRLNESILKYLCLLIQEKKKSAKEIKKEKKKKKKISIEKSRDSNKSSEKIENDMKKKPVLVGQEKSSQV